MKIKARESPNEPRRNHDFFNGTVEFSTGRRRLARRHFAVRSRQRETWAMEAVTFILICITLNKLEKRILLYRSLLQN
jgi:hypothetical protein